MSNQAVRLGDFVNTICKKIPPGVFSQGSNNTFTNNRPQVRMFDKSSPGPGIAITGSISTFVNNRPAVRLKDKVVCGKIQLGSFNTFIN